MNKTTKSALIAAIVIALGSSVPLYATTVSGSSTIQQIGVNLSDTQVFSLSGGSWYSSSGKIAFTIKNTTGEPLDLSKQSIQFNVPQDIFAALDLDGVKINGQWLLTDQYSHPSLNELLINATLAPNDELTIPVSISSSPTAVPNAYQGNLTITATVGQPVKTDGEIAISIKPQNVGVPPKHVDITVSSPFFSVPKLLQITDYSTPVILSKLSYGEYTITATTDSGLVASTTPSTISVNSSTPKPINLYYSEDPTMKKATFTLPAKPISSNPHIQIPNTVGVTLKNSAGIIITTQDVEWGKSITVPIKESQPYLLTATSLFDGSKVLSYSQTVQISSNSTINIKYVANQAYEVKPITLNISNLGSGMGTLNLSSKDFNGLYLQVGSIDSPTVHLDLPVATYSGYGISNNGTFAQIKDFNLASLSSLDINYTSENSGKLVFHATFPYTGPQPTNDTIFLTDKYFTNLIMSNYVAGALLGHLMNESPQADKITYQKDYLYGSILGQLLQENLQTQAYESGSSFINPPQNYPTLMGAGQGGPYQLNDYAKRLEDGNGVGMINYITMQKALGFSVEDQDKMLQDKKVTPPAIDDIYFGPMATTYFHYNDIQRLYYDYSIQGYAAGNAANFSKMIQNFTNGTIPTDDSFFDMLLNSAYNLGPTNNGFMSLMDKAINYTPGLGSKIVNYDTGQGILYVTQVRFYCDQLYGKVNLDPEHPNLLLVPMGQLRSVFENAFASLSYVDANGNFNYIPKDVCQVAFDNALSQNQIALNNTLSMSNSDSRAKIFDILDTAIDNVTSTLNIKFSTYTNETLSRKAMQTGVSVVTSKASLAVGEQGKVFAIVYPLNSTVQFSSSNPTVASVDANGNVLAKEKGIATITASFSHDGKVYKSLGCDISIGGTLAPTLTLSGPVNSKLFIGSTLKVVATQNPIGTNLTFVSSNPTVATVDASGVVKGISAGFAHISATYQYNGKSYTTAEGYSVGVEAPIVPTITLSSPSQSVDIGGNIQLSSTQDPIGTTLKYASSNTAIVKVTATGLVTGIAKGSANITASYVYNGKTYKSTPLTITVSDKLVTPVITLSGPSDNTLLIGKTLQVTSNRNPLGASFAYKSSKPTIATVDANGIVTGIAKGTTTIYAQYKVNNIIYKSPLYTVNVTATPVIVPTITLSGPAVNTMEIGKTLQLLATANPVGSSIQYLSSDSTVAAVDSNGIVTALKAGTSIITASYSYDGKAIATVNGYPVVVTAPSIPAISQTKSVVISGNEWYLSGESTFTLTNNTDADIDLDATPITVSGVPAGMTVDCWAATLNGWAGVTKNSNESFTINKVLPKNSTVSFTLKFSQNGTKLVPGTHEIKVSM